jgi:hypothetical protein
VLAQVVILSLKISPDAPALLQLEKKRADEAANTASTEPVRTLFIAWGFNKVSFGCFWQSRFEEAERLALFSVTSFVSGPPSSLDQTQRIDAPPALTLPHVSLLEVPSAALRKASNSVPSIPSVAMSTPPPMHQKLALERTLSARHTPTLPPHEESELEHSPQAHVIQASMTNGVAAVNSSSSSSALSPPRPVPATSPRMLPAGSSSAISPTAGGLPALLPTSSVPQPQLNGFTSAAAAGMASCPTTNKTDAAAHESAQPPLAAVHMHNQHAPVSTPVQPNGSGAACAESGPGSQWVVEVTVHEARDLPTPPQRTRGVRDVFCCASLLHPATDLTVRVVS